MSARDFLLLAAVLAAWRCRCVLSQIIEQKVFSCEGRPNGYYADVSSGCQIYHMCDGLGRQFSYSCPNTTLFQQRMLICDHWYMVNCSKAELDYGANLLIGQRGKPFVEDGGDHPYHRTPRPDLLAHPSAAEFNIIYRTGRAQGTNSKNLVGADKYETPKDANTPAYFLPSHWSTEYAKERATTEKAAFVKVKSKGEYKKTHHHDTFKKEDGNLDGFKAAQIGGVKKGNFSKGDEKKKITPPANLRKPNNPNAHREQTRISSFQNENPRTSNFQNENTRISNFQREDQRITNFQNGNQRKPSFQNENPIPNFQNSNFQNEKPISNFPNGSPNLHRDNSRISSGNSGFQNAGNDDGIADFPPFQKGETAVNFRSNFKATTPVYPKVAPTEIPLEQDEAQRAQLSKILLPPIGNQGFTERGKVNFPSNFKATTPVYPKVAPPEAAEGFIPEEINAQLAPPKQLQFADDAFDVKVNFASNFKATTPVYPASVTQEAPLASEETPAPIAPKTYGLSSIVEPPKLPNQKYDFFKPVKVNFRSDFKATTPVYPKFVTAETPLAIQDASIDPNKPILSTVIQPPKSAQTSNHQQPSAYYEPPLPERAETPAKSNLRTLDGPNQFQELRRMFLIPDYEFPLDASAVRPNYDQGPNSFQVNPFSFDLTPRKHA